MSKITYPKVMTANRLRDGVVVYLTSRSTWSEHLADAHAVTEPDEIARLEEKAADGVRSRELVGPYLFPVANDIDGSLVPLGQRERIRSSGPTTGTDFHAPHEVA